MTETQLNQEEPDNQESRVYWHDGMKSWAITGYKECAFVTTREDLFSVDHANFPAAKEIWGKRAVQAIGGEAHKKLHSFLMGYFSTRRINKYRTSFIRPMIEQQIDKFAGRGQVELATEFADQIPISVVAAVLGLPYKDETLLERRKRWRDAIIPWAQTSDQVIELREAALQATGQFAEILLPVILARKTNPQNDLISALWDVGPSIFKDWNESDILDQCRLIFHAGGEGVARLICSVAYLLVTDIALRESALTNRKTLLAGVIEEVLRLHSPALLRARIATQDIELGGILIRQDDRVYPNVPKANRDPERFPNPSHVDIRRTAISNHLAFNLGPRYCAGAPLARAEAFEAIDALLNRLRNLRLQPEAESPRFEGFLFAGFRPLHILFDPAPV